MKGPSFILAALLLLLVIHEGRTGSLRQKREDEDEPIRKELEKRAKELPLERFDSDPIVLQSVDTVNEKTIYKDPQNDAEYYERQVSDKGKEVVVLKEDEDKFPDNKDKRVYILLKQSDLPDKPKKYYPFVAYLLNPEKGHDSSKLIEHKGKKYAVEWTVWHDGVVFGVKYSFAYSVCRYSLIIPCKPDLAALKMSMANSTAAPTAVAEVSIGKGPPFPTNEYKDFFRDLENNVMNGRTNVLGMVYDFLDGGVLTGVGKLWCGLSGAILGQCHQYDAENGFTKSQIGTPVVRSDGKILAGGASESFGSNGILGTLTNAVFKSNTQVPKDQLNQIPSDVAVGPSQSTQVVYAPPPAGYGGMFGRKRRDAEPRIRGWRTVFQEKIEPGALTKPEKDIFFGVGFCPPAPDAKSSAELYAAANTEKEVFDFYLNLLRQQCFNRIQLMFPALVADKLVERKGKEFSLIESHKLVSECKLTWIEEQKLCSAMELVALSQTYKTGSDQKEKYETKTPLGKEITKSAEFLENFSINFVSLARSKVPKHYIRLQRHLIQIIRALMDRVREESVNLEECADCKKDKELHANDKVLFMGLIKFLIYAPPFQTDNVDTEWEAFFKKNIALIEAAVAESGV